MKLNIKKIGIVFLLFVYLFVPPFISVGTGIIGSLFFVLYIFANLKKIEKNLSGKSILMVMVGNIILIGYAFFSYICVYNGLDNIIAVYSGHVYIISFTLCGAIVICDICAKNNYSEKEIWKFIIYAGLIQGILSLAAYFINPIQTFLCALLENIMATDVIEWWRNYRLYGLSCSLTYSMPIVQSIIGGMALIYAKKYNIKFLFFVPILWVSALINARIALVVIAIELFVMFMDWLHYKHNFKVKKSVLILWIIGIMGGTFACVFIWIKEVDMGRIIDPIVEVLALLQGEKIITTEGYISYFWNDSRAFVMPKGRKLIWGGGIWNHVSDVGYIYSLWAGGIVYSVLLYLFYFSMLRKWYKKLNRQSAVERIMPIMCGITLFVVNIKGKIFGGMNEYINLCYLLIGMSFFIKKNRDTRKGYYIE